MKMRPFSLLLIKAFTVVMLITLCGNYAFAAVGESGAGNTATATLQSIIVSPDANQVEISADKALTYTFYKTANPARAVIDLAQTEPGNLSSQDVNAGTIKRITIAKHSFGGGFLTRVEILLSVDDEFSVNPNPIDGNKLLVVFGSPKTPEKVNVEAKPTLAPETSSALATVPEQPVAAVPSSTDGVPKEQPTPVQPVDARESVKQEVTTPADAASEQQHATPEAAKTSLEPSPVQRVLTAVELQKDGIEIKIAGGVDTYKSFTISKPDRLIIDIWGARSALKSQSIDINSMGIAKARIGTTPEKARVVFDAKRSLPPYQIIKDENGLRVQFTQNQDGPTPIVTTKEVDTVAAPPKSGHKGPATIGAIDFEVKGDSSLIIVSINGNCSPGKPIKTAKGYTLTFKNCQLARKLQRAIDTSSFASVVQGITPYQIKGKTGNDARLLVRLRAEAPFSVTQDGERVIWEIRNTDVGDVKNVKPLPELSSSLRNGKEDTVQSELASEAGLDIKQSNKEKQYTAQFTEKKHYTGKKVSLEFSDADVRKIFQLIAEVSNLNFLIADDVTGTISIKLVNVPWDQALDVILESKGLEMKREGNIIQIKPKGKFKSIEQEELEAKKVRERLLPLTTEVFEVNFASVADVEKQFASMKSERGTITRDERTNRVIVKDVPSAIDEMRFLLKNIDMPEKQVLIEARIVEATTTFSRDLGVQWALHATDSSANVLNVTEADAGWGGVISLAPPTSGFNAADKYGAGVGLSFGKIGAGVQLDMRLSAAATAGQVKIISCPKVVTLNNKQAKISQGQAIYLPSTSSEGTKQEKVDATLSLEVKPHITPDGSIVMTITAKNDSPGTAPAGATAAVNKKEATTELLVKNGETTVIGGIYVDSDTESDSGVPFLMDIPLLGWMFKSNSKQKTKTELLIFITPRIVS
ncbi:MAG: type IV pilus secretin PilQ [Geobacter sp.]|nr:type IV pilus secretin PilQ [Geobacter sp.]